MCTCGKHQGSSNTILETNFLESLHITNLSDYAGFFNCFPPNYFIYLTNVTVYRQNYDPELSYEESGGAFPFFTVKHLVNSRG